MAFSLSGAMASTFSRARLLVFFSLAAAVGGVTFTTTSWCTEVVYVASLSPAGTGMELPPGQTLHLHAAPGTAGRIWGRTGCAFDANGQGSCETGDCSGELVCQLSGKPPATLAEFTLSSDGGDDHYDISVSDGFNLPMKFTCDAPGSSGLICLDAGCPDGGKVYSCDAGNFHLAFCP